MRPYLKMCFKNEREFHINMGYKRKSIYNKEKREKRPVS